MAVDPSRTLNPAGIVLGQNKKLHHFLWGKNVSIKGLLLEGKRGGGDEIFI